MLDYYCNIGDTIVIDSGVFKGRYVINDKAGSNGLLIDIWRPIGDSLKGCYKTKILIKTNYGMKSCGLDGRTFQPTTKVN